MRLRLQMRELSAQLVQLNHRVGGKSGLRDGDLGCLDHLARTGAQSPSAMARALQVHPATMTGMLDRLEADGWIVRERDPADRRAVLVRSVPRKTHEILGLYGEMNGALDAIGREMDPRDLAAVIEFLTRAIEAGRAANASLAAR